MRGGVGAIFEFQPVENPFSPRFPEILLRFFEPQKCASSVLRGDQRSIGPFFSMVGENPPTLFLRCFPMGIVFSARYHCIRQTVSWITLSELGCVCQPIHSSSCCSNSRRCLTQGQKVNLSHRPPTKGNPSRRCSPGTRLVESCAYACLLPRKRRRVSHLSTSIDLFIYR